MAAAKKTPATDKPARKARTPKPVTDLATATTALSAAKRKAERTAKARAEAVAADGLAQTELEQAKAAVKRFYSELMGESVDDSPATEDAPDADGYEADGVHDDFRTSAQA